MKGCIRDLKNKLLLLVWRFRRTPAEWTILDEKGPIETEEEIGRYEYESRWQL